MRRFFNKIRCWLIKLLGGVDMETALLWEADAETKAHSFNEGKIEFYERYAKSLYDENKRLCEAVRGICKNTASSYYDWCCDYCAAECDKRNGWCRRFRA